MQKGIFERLRPICVKLTKEPTRTNVFSLFSYVKCVELPILQELQEYVLFPLRIILKRNKPGCQDIYVDVYTCMEYVLGHTHVIKWEMFQDIFNMSCLMLSCPNDQSKVASLSEELQLAIIQTIRTLVKSTEYRILQHLYTVWSLPILGHAVSLLLNIAESKKARNLRVLAMECLLDLSQADSKYSQCIKSDIGNIFASFLPGISITLCKILTGDQKQGYNVTTKAVYVWMRIVSLVMDDKLLDVARQKEGKKNNNMQIDEKLSGLVVERNSQWLNDTASKLCVLVKQVQAALRQHSNWRVRQAIVQCSEHLLLHCTRSLQDSVPVFLEILVGLIGDEYSIVAGESRRALDLFSQTQKADQQRHLVEILEENLHKLATSLPREIRAAEDEDKLALIKLLTGYLTLLGGRVKGLLLSVSHLKRLSMALVQVLQLDCNDIKILEERTHLSGHGESAIHADSTLNLEHPRKYFKHFHDVNIFHELQSVCRILGYFGDINLLVDHFLDIFHESSTYRMSAILIINELMLGTTGKHVDETLSTKEGQQMRKHNTQELEMIVRMLVDEYLNPMNFSLVTSVQTLNTMKEKGYQQPEYPRSLPCGAQSPLLHINSNIVQIGILIEGIGNFSKVLGFNFNPLLMTVLYKLLEKLGEESSYISSTAFLALRDICKACGYKSLDDLIRCNADYLMNSLSLNLRHFNNHKKSPHILKIMLQYSSAQLLPLVNDTFQEILICLDENYQQETSSFIGILQEVTKAILRWFPPDTDLCELDDNPKHRCKRKSSEGKRRETSTDGEGKRRATSTDCEGKMIEGSTGDEGKRIEGSIGSTDVERNSIKCSGSVESGEGVKKFFLDYHKLRKIADGNVSQEDMASVQPDGSADQEDPEVTKKVALHVHILQEVMLRCKHLLSCENGRLRLLVLDTIGCACKALQKHQDELLPLIHQVWSQFSQRFADEEGLVTVKAVETLKIMSDVSKEFISRRTVKDIFPQLLSFLHRQGHVSLESESAYQFTSSYKLQHAVLMNIGQISSNIDLEGSDFDIVASACLPYLSCKQPQSLQKLSVAACLALIAQDGDLMWLKLNCLHIPAANNYTLPDSRFTHVKIPNSITDANEYTTNVLQLLKHSLIS